MVFQHSGARDFDLGGGFHYSGSYPMVFQHSAHVSTLTSPPLSHRTGHAPATRRGTRLRRPWHRLGRGRSRAHAGAAEGHAAADMEGIRGCWRHGGDPGLRHAKLRRVPCGPVVVTVA